MDKGGTFVTEAMGGKRARYVAAIETPTYAPIKEESSMTISSPIIPKSFDRHVIIFPIKQQAPI